MQCITGWEERQRRWGAVVHTIGVLGLVLLLTMGCAPESLGGWVTCPVPGWVGEQAGRQASRKRQSRHGWAWRVGWSWLRRSWPLAALRSEVLLALVLLTDRWEWDWVCLLPWLAWLWKGLGLVWPNLGRQPLYTALGQVWDRATGVALVGLGLTWLGQHPEGTHPQSAEYRLGMLPLGLCLSGETGEASVNVVQDEAGVYQVRLRGEFVLRVDGAVEVYKRLLVIFLGLLEVPDETRGSRRTRDGRTPFVRQEQMAKWAGVPHPVISRWVGYGLNQDWRRLLSQRWGEVLTLEVQQQIIDVWVLHPWWTAQRVWQQLRRQGSAMTLNQVKQAGRESGWTALRQRMTGVYRIEPESFRPRDEWLTRQLLAQVQELVTQLEALGGLPSERQHPEGTPLMELETLCEDLELRPVAPRRPLPWVFQVEHLLFGHWAWIEDGSVQCIYCGTNDVSRKSRKPRLKRYVDRQGQEQTVEVYRYYCHNPGCRYKTFTNLPRNLLPHSRWTVDHHLAALQLYEWSHSVYRCTGEVLGVSKITVYRWVSRFGYDLMPVAALFGVVRSSGVVGIDEKYVLVPKNDKPESDMKRWMYVYFAVDCYTYDLLHLEIYPYNTKLEAHAFLLALRAKGYHPRVIVTDMRVDYGGLIAHVFPKAVHHECIFHALQQVHKHFKEVYGKNYADTHPEREMLRADIDRIFDARTKRTARRRYEQVMAQRKKFVAETPSAEAIFGFLERHWPRLVNAIESRHIPTTNNATEEVIRIFNQHYKTFCGFENVESARCYLAVFEKVYRFTPFSNDAQERIRGKCPLELAGYEVRKLPMAHLFRGLALQWPTSAFQELVPNV
jgi:transposase-like protein